MFVLFTQTGLHKDRYETVELTSELRKDDDDDVSDVVASSQHLNLPCVADDADLSGKSSDTTAGITATVTGTTDTVINDNGDSNGLLAGDDDDVILTAEDADDVAEAGTRESDQCNSASTLDASRLDVVDITHHGEPSTAEEFDKAFIISDSLLVAAESTNGNDRLAADQSADCSEAFSADTDGLHTVDSVECRPDSSERHRFVDTSTGMTDDGAHLASAAGDSAVSSACDTLRSLVSQLKSAISSGITQSCTVKHYVFAAS